MEQVSVWRISRCLGLHFFYWLAGKLFGNENKKNKGKKVKRIEDIELPGFMSMFNDNMVSASI